MTQEDFTIIKIMVKENTIISIKNKKVINNGISHLFFNK